MTLKQRRHAPVHAQNNRRLNIFLIFLPPDLMKPRYYIGELATPRLGLLPRFPGVEVPLLLRAAVGCMVGGPPCRQQESVLAYVTSPPPLRNGSIAPALARRLPAWRYAGDRRDARLDLLRGFAALTMIVDHVSGGDSWLYWLSGGIGSLSPPSRVSSSFLAWSSVSAGRVVPALLAGAWRGGATGLPDQR